MSTSSPSASGHSDQQDTTIKVYGRFSTLDTDLQTARNTLSLAIRDYSLGQTPELKKAMEAAQRVVHNLEEEYKASRQLLQEHVSAKMKAQGKRK